MPKKKDLLKKKEDENLEDENLQDDEDTSEDDEENSDDENEKPDEDESEDADADDADADEDEDSSDDLISMDAYKGLQRTLNKANSALKKAQDDADAKQTEFDEYKTTLDSSDIVMRDLQKSLIDANKRVTALEEENDTNKVEAMQSDVILNDFPALARFKEYIPSADSKDEFTKNATAFAELLGEKVTKALDEELEGSTVSADEEVTGPTQVQLDKSFDKTMALAVPGKEKEYEKAMADYMALLAEVK